MSRNYDFMLDRATALCGAGARILDFGCGYGAIVARGRSRGLDVVGVDTFVGYYADWLDLVEPSVREHVARYAGRLPYPNDHFDVVIANQVFEHVPRPVLHDVLAEIARVTRPGGFLLASFPVRETWYEGHVGLYFAHRLSMWPRLRHGYMKAARQLGLGLYEPKDPDAWAVRSAATLDESCHFHAAADVRSLIADAFGEAPISVAPAHFDAHLAGSRLAGLARFLEWPGGRMLKAVAMHIRSGLSLQARKAGTRQAQDVSEVASS